MKDVLTQPPEAIAQALLEEIPGQVVSYLKQNNITIAQVQELATPFVVASAVPQAVPVEVPVVPVEVPVVPVEVPVVPVEVPVEGEVECLSDETSSESSSESATPVEANP